MSAAFLRLTGYTQDETTKAVGIDVRTLQRWEGCSWWADVVHEATSRWLSGLAGKSRRSLELGVEQDPRLALSVLERLMPELMPPRFRAEVSMESDAAALILTVFWRYVMALHMSRGLTIAEAFVEARRDPDAVEAWGREKGLLTAGSGEVVE